MTGNLAVQPLVTGFPGKSPTHVGMGWSSVFLVQGDGLNALVDTGPPVYVDLLRGGLARHGLQPDDITHILVTHLHWDHVCNFTMFDRARVVVSITELEWAERQPPGTRFVPDLHVARLRQLREQLILVADGERPLPGVTVMATPGHTPGHVAYRVATGDAEVVFAGDAVKNRFELASGEVDSTMDPAASLSSIRRLRRCLIDNPSAVLVPGHDVRLRWAEDAPVALDAQRCDVVAYLGDRGEPVQWSLT